jgi:hypothetical protein
MDSTFEIIRKKLAGIEFDNISQITIMRAKKEPVELMADRKDSLWTLDVFRDLNIEERTQKPPSAELIERLNRLVSKPPFCWTNKYKDDMPR